MFFNFLLIVIGFVLLVIGSDLLVKGASNIATKFHIPDILIGLTIVAIGTSAPELIVTIQSAFTGNTGLIVGNAIGSNFCNLLLILGIMALIRPVSIDSETKKIHLPFAIFSTFIVLFMCFRIGNQIPLLITRVEGILLLIFFLFYLFYLISLEIKDIVKAYRENKEKKQKGKSTLLSVFFFVLGIVLLKYGSDFVVDSAVDIAQLCGLSEAVIGSTIVAIGTASPELVTSIVAIIKKDTDLAIGNLVGSCVLNLLLIFGLGAVITPLEFTVAFIGNLILLLLVTSYVWGLSFIGKKNTLTRFKGVSLLLLFGVYLFMLFKF